MKYQNILLVHFLFSLSDYPDDRAKAVIQEIEEIKKKEAGKAHIVVHIEDPLKDDPVTREAVAAAIKNIKHNVKMRERSRSVSSGISIIIMCY